MNVNCQSCGAKYAIADNKVHGRKVKVRCKSCNTTIVVDGTELAPDGDVQIGNVVTDPKTLDGSELSPLLAEGEMWSVSVTDDDQRELNTSQVIAAFRAGQFSDATFIWKEGMGDWLPLLDVPEFQSLRQPVAKPFAAGIPRPAAGAAAVAAAPRVAAPQVAALQVVAPQVAQPAARVSMLPKPRTLTRDLFSTASTQEEETAPAPSPFAATSADATGARNESSVLFSLDALKRQSVPAPPPQKAADDPFGLGNLGASGGGMGGFGGTGALFSPDAHALLTAPSVAPPPSVAVARPGVAAFEIAPPPKKKSPMIWIGAAVVLLAGAGGAYALFGGKAPSEVVAEGTSTSSTDTSNADRKTEEAKADADKKAEEAKAAADADKKAEEAKATTDTDKKAEEAKPSSQHSGTATTPGTKPTANPAAVAAAAAATPKPGKAKPAEAAEPSGGGSTFNVGAAKSALAAAAGQAASCKKGDQGGSGKATVTFSPSGLASSVTISGISGFASNCVNGLFRRARVPAFTGAPVTVSKGFKIPE